MEVPTYARLPTYCRTHTLTGANTNTPFRHPRAYIGILTCAMEGYTTCMRTHKLEPAHTRTHTHQGPHLHVPIYIAHTHTQVVMDKRKRARRDSAATAT